jgi:tRNA-modifying protein YgfZ
LSADTAQRAAAARRGACLFRLDRALLEVRGADRVRWLDGMLSNEIARLSPDPQRSGCHAFMLSPQGRILADFDVLDRGDALWLDAETQGFEDVRARLERYVIADDVQLAPRTDVARLGLEGADAPALLARALNAEIALAPECGGDFTCAGVPIVVAAYGWSGAPAFQLFVPRAHVEPIAASLAGAVAGDAAVLEVLRIEAGIPRAPNELGEKVLPPELGPVWMQRSVSAEKGCYTGQEIVARLVSRNAESHRLVSLRFAGDPAPPGSGIRAQGKAVGEVTSSARSTLGAIGLGFVRRPADAVGTELEIAGGAALVTDAPLASRA